MVPSLLSPPYFTPVPPDAAVQLPANSEKSESHFLAEFRKALAPGEAIPEAGFTADREHLTDPQSDAVEQTLAVSAAFAESALLKNISLEKNTSTLPGASFQELPDDIPAVSAETIIRFLVQNYPLPGNFPTGGLPQRGNIGTEPESEQFLKEDPTVFILDSVRDVPFEVTSGNSVLKAEIPYMPEPEFTQTLEKPDAEIQKVQAGLIQREDIGQEFPVQSAGQFTGNNRKKTEPRSFDGQILSLEVTRAELKNEGPAILLKNLEKAYIPVETEVFKKIQKNGYLQELSSDAAGRMTPQDNAVKTSGPQEQPGGFHENNESFENAMQEHGSIENDGYPIQPEFSLPDGKFPAVSIQAAQSPPAGQQSSQEIVSVPVKSFISTAVPAIHTIAQSEGGTIRMVLMPEALGQVKMEVSVSDKMYTSVHIQVENHEAKQQIEAQMPALKEQMAQSGMVIEKIHVEVKSDSTNLSQQFTGFQQQMQKEDRESRQKFMNSFKHLQEGQAHPGDQGLKTFIEQYI